MESEYPEANLDEAAKSSGSTRDGTAGSGSDVTWLPGWRLSEMIETKAISPVEITRQMLDRIEALDPQVNAYITVDAEGALAQAKLAEEAVMRGDKLGPLHGLPLSVKDLTDTKGLRSTEGSLIFKDRIPDEDEILVERLRSAGAVILGKTNTPEFGSYARTKNLVAGETRNPWDLRRITGASSGGAAAAVASGMSVLAISGDGGGSTRIPAAYNGVFGVQPSAGRIPKLEPVTAGPHQLSTGPTTIDVRDAAILLNVIAGPDPRDSSAIQSPRPDFTDRIDDGVKGFRMAWSDDFGHIPIIDDRVLALQKSAFGEFSAAGANLEEPGIELYDFFASWSTLVSALGRVARLQAMTDAEKALLSPPIAGFFINGGRTPPTAKDIEEAELIRADIRKRISTLFESYDLICTPVVTLIAPIAPDGWDQPYSNPVYAHQFGTPYTHLANYLGLAAASVPCGFVDGLPVGLQIIADRMNEQKVFRAARAFERQRPWSHIHPSFKS